MRAIPEGLRRRKMAALGQQMKEAVEGGIDWPLGFEVPAPYTLHCDELNEACRLGNADVVEAMLKAGVPADSFWGDPQPCPNRPLGITGDISTPLHEACFFVEGAHDLNEGRVECVRLLLHYGATLGVDSHAYWGGSPENNLDIQLGHNDWMGHPDFEDLLNAVPHVPVDEVLDQLVPNTRAVLRMFRDEPERREKARRKKELGLRLLACLGSFHVLRMRAARRAYAPDGAGFVHAAASFLHLKTSFDAERQVRMLAVPEVPPAQRSKRQRVEWVEPAPESK